MELSALCKAPAQDGRFFNKLWKIMRVTVFLLFVCTIHVSAHVYAQKVNLSANSITLEKALIEIKQQTGYSFFWNDQLIASAPAISVHLKDATVEQALDECLKNLPFDYEIRGQFVYINPKKDIIKTQESFVPPVDVHGRVTDSIGNPLSGASVALKGSKRGTLTDVNGNFVLTGVIDNSTLTISFTGFITKTYRVNGGNSFTIFLSRSRDPLDEVQIIAYGTTTQRLNTGDVGTVSGTVIQEQPVSNPLGALEGRVPGLVVTQTNGLPGSSYSVQIRGLNSITQGSEPLFIIDGVQFASGNSLINLLNSALGSGPNSTSPGGLSPFSTINPQDIESIEILKDADATSIYGSRGANGVILITTKKGKIGKTKFSANIYTGIGTVTRTMDFLNTQQYLAMRNEAFLNDGLTPDPISAPDLLVWDTTRYTDFKKMLIGGHSNITDAQASVSGGDLNTQFLLGAGYNYQSTVFPGTQGEKRASFHFSFNHSSTDKKFNTYLSVLYSADQNNELAADLTTAITLPPDLPPLYDSSGKLNWEEGGASFNNPNAYLLQSYSAKTNNLLGSFQVRYNITEGLFVKANFGYNTIQATELLESPSTSQNPTLGPVTGSSSFGNNAFKNWNIDPQIQYLHRLWIGNLDLLIGGSWQEQTNNSNALFATGYTNDALLGSQSAAGAITATNGYNDYRYQAVFARVNYNIEDKYILNLSGRRDGSSRFGPGNQFGNFGSIGAAWIFSSESFFQSHLKFLSFGKLRGSYGTSGNDQIGDYQYLNSWTNTIYPYLGTPGLVPARLYNPNYSWEVSHKSEIAIDLGFLKDRILLSAAYYLNKSNNQLIQYNLPVQTGFPFVTKNFPGVVENKGTEIQLSAKIIRTNSFSWNATFNISFPTNKLVSFPDLATSSYNNIYVVGQSLSVLNLYQSTGVNSTTGIYQFKGKDSSTPYPSYPDDLHVSGNLDPKYYGGFRNTFTYKNWSLDIFFDFKKQLGPTYQSSFSQNVPGFEINQPTGVLDRWQKPGDIAPIQQFTQNSFSAAGQELFSYYLSSTAVYGDASYIRLKNLAFSYTLPANWLKKTSGENVKIYLQCQNLVTITSYQGNDPESRNYFSLPPLRVITVGLQATF